MLRGLFLAAVFSVGFLACVGLWAGGKEIKVACVGDSITEGFGIPDAQRKELSWPSVLQKILGDKYEVLNLGVCGNILVRDRNSSWNLSARAKELPKFKPDIIIMMLGTNDSQKKAWVSEERFESDLRKYIAEFRKINRKVKIYICFPPPSFAGRQLKMSGDSYSSAFYKKTIIPILQKVAKEEKIPTIDVFNQFKRHPEYFADGLHPNIKGADAIGKFIAAQILKDAKKKRH
jgi:lysophospholipase L1-like esterase